MLSLIVVSVLKGIMMMVLMWFVHRVITHVQHASMRQSVVSVMQQWKDRMILVQYCVNVKLSFMMMVLINSVNPVTMHVKHAQTLPNVQYVML